MPKYRVSLTRQIVFSRTIEVEADDEDKAGDLADEEVDEDDVLDEWEPGTVERYAAPDVEKAA